MTKFTTLINCSLSLLLVVFSTKLSQAQMVGNDYYMQGTSLEVGINGEGGFEGIDRTASPTPAGYHARSPIPPYRLLPFGFIANPAVDGWIVYDGDFYTPGAPENGWGIEIGTTGLNANNNYENSGAGGIADIPGRITFTTTAGGCNSVDWDGQDTIDGTNLHVKINYFLQTPDLYYTTTVSITNNTSNTIPEMYYYRNLDPDNGAQICDTTFTGGGYETTNSIVSEPIAGDCSLAHVSATCTAPTTQPMSYLGLAGVDSNFRACYGGFTNRDASDLWNGIGFTQTVGSSLFGDNAISLAYRIQNLAPGATQTFRFVVILSDSAAAHAINNLLHLDYLGSSGLPPAACRADTARTCGAPVSVGVSGSATADFTWSWSPVTGLSSTTTPSVIADPPVTTSYTITGTPISACASVPVYIYVVVQVVPGEGNNPYITPVPDQCAGNPPVTLTVDSAGGVWSGTGITDPALGIFDPAIGAGTYLITYVTPGLCNTTDTVLVTVFPAAVTITQPPVQCIGNPPINLVASAPRGVWTGPGITDPALGTFDPNLLAAGTYKINYTITGVCPLKDSVFITVDSVYDPTIIDHPPICKNEPSFNFTSVHSGGTWSGAGITNSTLGTFNPALVTVGAHIITYKFADPCGSSDTTTINVLAVPNPTITDVPLKCINSGTFTMIAADAGGVWKGAGITDTIAGTFDPFIAGAGIHNIVYTIPGRCPATDSSLVTVVAIPVLSIAADTTEGCSPTTVTFTGITDQPGGHYAWDFGNGSSLTDTSSLASPTYVYAYPGSYTVSFTYTNTTGCVNNTTASGLITVHPQPVALMEISPKPADILTPSVNFLDRSTGSATAWLWDFGSYGTSVLQNPTIVYNDTGSFAVQLIVTSVFGCLDTVADNAYIAPVYLFYTPNAFTPDGDGVNDVFRAYGNQMSSDGFEMNIFDRWGNRIFRTTDPYEGWNGANNNIGKVAEKDVYVYRIKLKDYSGTTHEYVGQVTLIK